MLKANFKKDIRLQHSDVDDCDQRDHLSLPSRLCGCQQKRTLEVLADLGAQCHLYFLWVLGILFLPLAQVSQGGQRWCHGF